ncbi:ATP synthase subunit a [Weissella ceti]|nr:F0F1 ATP synthase subunit A [Weissella ceti]AIM64789.1 ATP synthase subunit a [Weissella ceti]
MIIEFTNGIVEGSLPNKTGNQLKFYAFMLFMFVFVSNQIGLFLHVGYNDVTYLKSATADPLVAFTLALISIGLAHFLSVRTLGFKGYIKNVYLSPYPALLPINLIDQFTSFMTLGLRLFGNIFAGEMLLALLWEFASSAGLFTIVPGMFMTIIWVGFSMFIGAIQAYVFVTLTTVYIAEKMEA